jgi:hypothetical protein
VAVPGKRQLDAQLGGAIKAVGIVAQKAIQTDSPVNSWVCGELPFLNLDLFV